MRIVRAIKGSWSTPILLSALLGVIVLVGYFEAESFQQSLATMLVFAVAVIGTYIFVGNTGITSFGHIAFMGIGAYVGALLTIPSINKGFSLPDLPGFIQNVELPPVPAILIAAAVAGLFGLFLAGPLMRLSGLAAAISLLSVLVIVNVVLNEAESVTRGTRSLTGIPLDLTTYGALAAAVCAIFVAFAYQQSRWGLKARATREDEYSARASGIVIARERTVALVLSAMVMGSAGALYSILIGTINPSAFYIELTTVTLVMLIVGGVRSLTGAVLGTVAIFALSEILRSIENGLDLGVVSIPERPGLELIGLGLAALAILIWKPSGLTGGKEVSFDSIGQFGSRLLRRLRRA